MARSSSYGCKTIQINNLDARVDDALLMNVFGSVGRIISVKIVHDRSNQFGGLSTGYIEFSEHTAAEAAIATLNGRKIFEAPIKLSWSLNANRTREDTSSHFHCWVGDLSPEVDDHMLGRAFSVLKSLSDARVMFDPNTGKSRGYGFVAFREKLDAEKAMAQMNGAMVGSKPIRLNWAHQRNNPNTAAAAASIAPLPSGSGTYSGAASFEHPKRPTLNYNTVIGQSSPFNTTVYIGNLPHGTPSDMMVPLFQPYGYINDIKLHSDRGYAFVKLDTHENAAMAICYLSGAVFNGSRLKISWGKDKQAEATAGPQAYVAPASQQYFGFTGYNYSDDNINGNSNDFMQQYQQYAYDPATYAAMFKQYQAAMEAAAQRQTQNQS